MEAMLVPSLDIRSSLVQAALSEQRFSTTDYLGNGAFEGFEAEKAEIEQIAATVQSLGNEVLADPRFPDVERYRGHMFPADEIVSLDTDSGLRQLAFAAAQLAVDEICDELQTESLKRPTGSEPLFALYPELFASLTRDGLMAVRPEQLPDVWTGSDIVFCWGEHAVFPHPRLAALRELAGELHDLAGAGELSVSVAIDPFRVCRLDALQPRLLADYWHGIRLTQGNLDSLDRHAVGVPTFHAAVGRSRAEAFFYPLLGTWFDWTARGDDGQDVVKRLYIREVRPAVSRDGEPLEVVASRELHAERDTVAHRFTHVDGKTCEFDAAGYEPSAVNPSAPLGVPNRALKLWRVDGAMTDDQWACLVGLHFRQNELIGEHFREAFPEWSH
jgi:hypothetical protein